MGDLREYSFADWFHIFLRAMPALVLATVIFVLPIVIAAALGWFVLPIGPR